MEATVPFYDGHAQFQKHREETKDLKLRLWRSHFDFHRFPRKQISKKTKFIYICTTWFFFLSLFFSHAIVSTRVYTPIYAREKRKKSYRFLPHMSRPKRYIYKQFLLDIFASYERRREGKGKKTICTL